LQYLWHSGRASFLAKLAPLGIFAISAAAAGTIDPEDLGRLETKGEKVFLISAPVICYACATILFMQACSKKLLDSLLMGLPNNTIQALVLRTSPYFGKHDFGKPCVV
jgi:hypothetical protein